MKNIIEQHYNEMIQKHNKIYKNFFLSCGMYLTIYHNNIFEKFINKYKTLT